MLLIEPFSTPLASCKEKGPPGAWVSAEAK